MLFVCQSWHCSRGEKHNPRSDLISPTLYPHGGTPLPSTEPVLTEVELDDKRRQGPEPLSLGLALAVEQSCLTPESEYEISCR